MLKVLRKRIHQVGNSRITYLHAGWLRKHKLLDGDYVNMVVTDNALIIVPEELDIDSDVLQKEIVLAQKILEVKEERKTIEDYKKLPKNERDEVEKLANAIREADEALDDGEGDIQ